MQKILSERDKLIFDLAYEQGYKDGHRDGNSGRMKISSISDENPKQIIELCSAYLGISYEAMYSKSRKREIVYARHMTINLLIKYTKLSLKDIGRLFNGRDHTTVIHARQSLLNWIKVEEETANDYKYLVEAIKRVLMDHGEIVIEPKKLSVKRVWSDFYRDYQKQKKEAELKVFTAITDDEPISIFHRPPAEYSNTGHLKLINELSEVG